MVLMDIGEIRRNNLRGLLHAYTATGGYKKAFATKIGIGSPQLTHITAEPPSRNIGARVARRVEVSFGLPRGWMDVQQDTSKIELSHLETSNADLIQVETALEPYPDQSKRFTVVRLSASDLNGDANLNPVSDNVFEEIVINDQAAKTLFGGRAANALRTHSFYSDSMLPTIRPDELLVLDINADVFTSDGIYLFEYDHQLYLKRLQRIKDELVVISDNPAYERWTIPANEIDKLQIKGMLVGKWDSTYTRFS